MIDTKTLIGMKVTGWKLNPRIEFVVEVMLFEQREILNFSRAKLFFLQPEKIVLRYQSINPSILSIRRKRASGKKVIEVTLDGGRLDVECKEFTGFRA